MNQRNKLKEIMQTGVTSLRLALITMVICGGVYPLVILAIAQTVTPYTANGWLVLNRQGEVVGSEIIAQDFHRAGYFQSRPSAVQFNASASGGSNLSPASSEVRIRAQRIIAAFGRSGSAAVPADLVTSSGSGLDPHITLEGARYQLERVAAARGQSEERIAAIMNGVADDDSRVSGMPIVNVFKLNLALDEAER